MYKGLEAFQFTKQEKCTKNRNNPDNQVTIQKTYEYEYEYESTLFTEYYIIYGH